MKPSHIPVLMLCIILPLAAGTIAGIASTSNLITWYETLNKPAFNPPDYLFGPVWTALYFLMGFSLFMVWRSPRCVLRTRALGVFGIQLVLNFAWSFIFFYYKQPGLAFAEIIVVWISIIAMILLFYRINKTSALLQVPYLLWVSFAGVLNCSIWILN